MGGFNSDPDSNLPLPPISKAAWGAFLQEKGPQQADGNRSGSAEQLYPERFIFELPVSVHQVSLVAPAELQVSGCFDPESAARFHC